MASNAAEVPARKPLDTGVRVLETAFEKATEELGRQRRAADSGNRFAAARIPRLEEYADDLRQSLDALRALV
jgi:hypothetical protein